MNGRAYPFVKKHGRDIYWWSADHGAEIVKEISRMARVDETVVGKVVQPFKSLAVVGRSSGADRERYVEAMGKAGAVTDRAADVMKAFFILFIRYKRMLDALEIKFGRQDPAEEARIEKERGWFVEVFLPFKRRDNSTVFTACWYPPAGLRRDRTVASRVERAVDDKLRPRVRLLTDPADMDVVVHEWQTVTFYGEDGEEETRVLPRYLSNFHWIFGHAEYCGRKRGAKRGETEYGILQELRAEIELRCRNIEIGDLKTKFGEYVVCISDDREHKEELRRIEEEFEKRYPYDVFCVY